MRTQNKSRKLIHCDRHAMSWGLWYKKVFTYGNRFQWYSPSSNFGRCHKAVCWYWFAACRDFVWLECYYPWSGTSCHKAVFRCRFAAACRDFVWLGCYYPWSGTSCHKAVCWCRFVAACRDFVWLGCYYPWSGTSCHKAVCRFCCRDFVPAYILVGSVGKSAIFFYIDFRNCGWFLPFW